MFSEKIEYKTMAMTRFDLDTIEYHSKIEKMELNPKKGTRMQTVDI